MTEITTAGGIVIPAGVSVTTPAPRPADGSCPGCGASKDQFKPVLGGMEVCMRCGLDREVERNG